MSASNSIDDVVIRRTKSERGETHSDDIGLLAEVQRREELCATARQKLLELGFTDEEADLLLDR